MISMARMMVWLYLAVSVTGQDLATRGVAKLLPGGAQIIETATVPARGAKPRALVLWMNAPRRVMSSGSTDADFVVGHHWFGPAFLTLMDPSRARVINTLQIHPNPELTSAGTDIALPFFTHDYLYYVPHPGKDHKGKPLLMRLRDLTGEGVAAQFALFDAVVSGVTTGSVLGYSTQSDTAVQYPIVTTTNHFNPVVRSWREHLLLTKPIRAGYWKFTWGAGHGDFESIDEEVYFDTARQLFVEKVTTRPYPGFALVHCNLDVKSLTKFLGGMQKVAPSGIDIPWLRDLIAHAAPSHIGSAGMVPIFNGTERTLTLTFRRGDRHRVLRRVRFRCRASNGTRDVVARELSQNVGKR